jgi:hypothetical protein
LKFRALLLLLALSACGDYPRPFLGNPGATARRLSQPPPVLLTVPAPTNALLTSAAAAAYANQIATTLAAMEIPAIAATPRKGDWVLQIDAKLTGNNVTPHFLVLDPAGRSEGDITAPPVSADDWSTASPATLQQAAKDDAPAISALLTQIQARIARSDPNSLLNRPAHIYLAGVTGAPGDGNQALAKQMGLALTNLGELVQTVPDGADMELRAEVKVTDRPGGTEQAIEIDWIVSDTHGERGRAVQLNAIPAGALDIAWGDVAIAAAQQGADGIRHIIETNSGGQQPHPNGAAAPTPTPTQAKP